MDICFLIDPDNKIVIHCHGVKGATWFAKHITTNVAPLYCEREYGAYVLRAAVEDGLKVSMKDANTGKTTPMKDLGWLTPKAKPTQTLDHQAQASYGA
jgi:hypothetical protein